MYPKIPYPLALLKCTNFDGKPQIMLYIAKLLFWKGNEFMLNGKDIPPKHWKKICYWGWNPGRHKMVEINVNP